MRVTEVTHERVKNLGSYESARVALTMSLDEGDDHQDALAVLKVEAYKFLNPKKAEEHDEQPTVPEDIRTVDDIPY